MGVPSGSLVAVIEGGLFANGPSVGAFLVEVLDALNGVLVGGLSALNGIFDAMMM